MVKVQVALYDLSRGIAKSMSMALLGKQVDGIWHTGVIVYGREFFFGGGIQSMTHEAFCAMHGGFRPEQYIDMGETEVPEDVFRDFIMEVRPRFTQATYNLFRHNCNNFSDEVCRFLVGRGIPEYIISLPNEVLQTPMGQMMLPMVEQMNNELHGGDPFAHAAYAPAAPAAPAAAATPTPAPSATRTAAPAPAAPVAPAVAAAMVHTPRDAEGHIYPLLSKHTKPLLSADTSMVPTVVKRLQGGTLAQHLAPEDQATLGLLATALAAGAKAPLPPGAWALVARLRADHRDADFLLLCLLRLMVLHEPTPPQVEEQRAALTPLVMALGRDDAWKNAPVLALALCTASNAFGTAAGCALMRSAAVLGPCVDAALVRLQHAQADVRQMAAALTFNYALALTGEAALEHMSDEATQILLSSLEGLLDEGDDLTAQRRLMACGCIMRRYKAECSELVEGCDLGHHVTQFVQNSPATSQAKHIAAEVAHLLQA